MGLISYLSFPEYLDGEKLNFVGETDCNDNKMNEPGVYYMNATGSYYCYYNGTAVTHYVTARWQKESNDWSSPFWVKRKESKGEK